MGALLLIAIQYRKRLGEREVHVDEDGREVVKLKGPWQVRSVPLPHPILSPLTVQLTEVCLLG